VAPKLLGDDEPTRALDLESTAILLTRVRAGDRGARRLPRYARDLVEADDLVQISLLRALDQVKSFEPRLEGAFCSRRVWI